LLDVFVAMDTGSKRFGENLEDIFLLRELLAVGDVFSRYSDALITDQRLNVVSYNYSSVNSTDRQNVVIASLVEKI